MTTSSTYAPLFTVPCHTDEICCIRFTLGYGAGWEKRKGGPSLDLVGLVGGVYTVMMHARRSMSYVTWPCCPDPPRVGVFCVFVASWIWLVLAPFLPPMSLAPRILRCDPSSRRGVVLNKKNNRLAEAGARTARPYSPARRYFFYFLDMDSGSLWIKLILTTTRSPVSNGQGPSSGAHPSSHCHLLWASLRFAIGRFFPLDNHDLTRGWFSFVFDDTRSQLQPL